MPEMHQKRHVSLRLHKTFLQFMPFTAYVVWGMGMPLQNKIFLYISCSDMIRAIHVVRSSVDFMWISIIYNKSKHFMDIRWTEMKIFSFFSFAIHSEVYKFHSIIYTMYIIRACMCHVNEIFGVTCTSTIEWAWFSSPVDTICV